MRFQRRKREGAYHVFSFDHRDKEQGKDTVTKYTLRTQLQFMHLLFFPLMVLSVNRALDTVISRKPKGMQTIITDLIDTYRIGKFRALFAGLVSAALFSMLFTTTFYSEKVVRKS